MRILRTQEGQNWSVFLHFFLELHAALGVVRKISRFGCLLPYFPSYSYNAIFATASHPIHVARQVRLFSSILEMSGLALERDMDTLFSNLPIVRHRFKYRAMLHSVPVAD